MRIGSGVLALAFTVTLLHGSIGMAETPDSCVFRYRPALRGDQGQQSVNIELELERALSQDGQRISQDDYVIKRTQEREVRVLDIIGKVPSRVLVVFRRADQQVQQKGQAPMQGPQPIDGKTYDVARVGEQLVILDQKGQQPVPQERELVRVAMSALGKPNPLAEMLDGRTVHKGESLELPAEVVQEFLGLDAAQAGSRMTLKLIEINKAAAGRQAVFATKMTADPHAATDLGMQIDGRWVVDPDSCQTLSATFQGPVRTVEKRGPIGAQYQITTSGQLRVKLTRQTPIPVARSGSVRNR